ncbi:MAG TPA: TonB-dependent receptor, partial [Bryobacteraceae bacterium]|nr:TonB-dependent receptor [Bryobacteraceae bacterium]
SGTIATFTRTPEEDFRLVAGYEVGNRGTHYANVGVSRLWSRWAASMRLRGHTTDGYFIIPEARRGSVDTPAAARFVAGDSRIDFLGSAQKFFLKLDILAETRDNGTRLTENTTSLGTLAGHYLREGSQNSFSALAYHTREVYRASFSSVTATRNSESITFLQTVPSTAVGAAATWKRSADLWSVIAGGDAQRVEGTSTDRLASGALRVGGGSQRQGGAFVQLAGGRRDNAQIFAGARQQFTSGGSEFFSQSGGFL